MNLIVPAALTLLSAGTPGDTTRLFDFAQESAEEWIVVNDGVMGGVSRSAFVDSDSGYASFQGVMSLENNGGFASVRHRIAPRALDGQSGLALRIRGDGRSYQVRLRTDLAFDGIAYRAEFETVSGEWQTITIPFSQFEPTWRGRRPPGAPPLEAGEVQQIGLMVADGIEGPFQLDVEWIQAGD
jgi:monofunctional biosynthetic peptidoglycan transglycosylase